MNHQPKTTQAGFTLVEVVLASILVVMLLGAAYELLFSGLDAWGRGEQTLDAQQNARAAVARVSRELRQATGLVAGPVSRSGQDYVLDQDNLIFTLPDGDTVWYYQDGDTLRRAVESSGAGSFSGFNIVAYKITQLEFLYNSNPPADSNLVSISLTAQGQEGPAVELFTRVHPRLL